MPFSFTFEGSFFRLSTSSPVDNLVGLRKRPDVRGRLLTVDGIALSSAARDSPT